MGITKEEEIIDVEALRMEFVLTPCDELQGIFERAIAEVTRLDRKNFSLTVRFEYLLERNKALGAKINELQGNFSHFHVDNEMNELCALCGLAVINAVHLRSR